MELESYNGELDILPEWGFDGSSTQQAEGHYSDLSLIPVRVYPDPFREDGYLVLCEVFNPDGSPHSTNTRSLIDDDSDEFWFGFEQEYIMMTDNSRPIGFPPGGFPEPQGPYYCAVGYHAVDGRHIVEDHMDACLFAGVGIAGTNAEVMLGQWEYQVLGKGAKVAGDDMIISRFLLQKISEDAKIIVELEPKPIKGDWNGSGMHSNFSFPFLRDTGGKDYVEKLCAAFAPLHQEHLAEYGAHNEERLTGAHETASFEKFSFGVSDRGASIRIPIYTIKHNYKGYLEDRRPASNADPYRVMARIIKTVKETNKKLIGKEF